MIWVFIIYFLTLFLFSVLLIIFFLFQKKDAKKENLSYPFISVLVAARNEEKNIIHCLSALDKLSYPKDKLEILVGNDHSTDLTREKIVSFISGRNNFKLVDIGDNLGNAKGKANVLAHLAKEAKGEYFFITDADIQVPEGWIQSLLIHFDERMGIVSGVTAIRGENLFSKLQFLEWVFAFGMVKVVSEMNMPVSAVGNNMAIKRKAYEDTEGYENIPFSITEDFELFKAVLKKDWKYKNLLNSEALAFSNPIINFLTLFNQRKRWMTGAFRLPLLLTCCLFVQSVFLPMILISLFLFPVAGITFWIIKAMLQQIFIVLLLKRLKLSFDILKYYFLFEIYTGLFSFALLIYYMIPGKVEWKGRKYKK